MVGATVLGAIGVGGFAEAGKRPSCDSRKASLEGLAGTLPPTCEFNPPRVAVQVKGSRFAPRTWRPGEADGFLGGDLDGLGGCSAGAEAWAAGCVSAISGPFSKRASQMVVFTIQGKILAVQMQHLAEVVMRQARDFPTQGINGGEDLVDALVGRGV